MKYFLIGLFCALAVWTALAVALVPKKGKAGKIPLVWTTDPNPQRDPQVDWFNQVYPDCNLSIDPDNSASMKVVVQSCAGMGPDIIGHVNESNYQTYHDAGILWDVTDVAKTMGFGPETLPETVRPLVSLKVLTPDGDLEDRQFCYPCNVYHVYLIYNKNLFDRYGVPYPPHDITWEKYIELTTKLTIYEEEGNKVPTVFGGAGAAVETILWEMGGDLLNTDGTRCTLDSKEAVDAMVYYHDLLFRWNVEPTPVQKAGVVSQGGWGGGFRNWFGEGRIGVLWGARWMLIQFRRFVSEQRKARARWIEEHPDEPEENAPEVLRMGACLVPRFADGRRYTRFGARCAGINRMSPNREKALNFLQFLANKEYSQTINDGADSKPGNSKYIAMELFRHPEWPEEEEVHQLSIDSVPFGRTQPRSMFIPNATVSRTFNEAKSQLTASPEMTREEIKRLMERTAQKINLTIARNIKRTPKLLKIYTKMLEKGAQPIVIPLEEVQ